MREVRGHCLKYLKREWNGKEGKGHKGFKKGGQAGSRGGCLKKGGWNPLTNYAPFSKYFEGLTPEWWN